MFTSIKEASVFLRARWRWVRGRCPLCNRNVHAAFSYYMADFPSCPVCTDETEADLRLWHQYRALGIARGSDLAGAPGEFAPGGSHARRI